MKKLFATIHDSSTVNTNEYVYFSLYGGSGGGSATVNGTDFSIIENTQIDIYVNRVSNATGEIFFIGHKKKFYSGTIPPKPETFFIIDNNSDIFTNEDGDFFVYEL